MDVLDFLDGERAAEHVLLPVLSHFLSTGYPPSVYVHTADGTPAQRVPSFRYTSTTPAPKASGWSAGAGRVTVWPPPGIVCPLLPR